MDWSASRVGKIVLYMSLSLLLSSYFSSSICSPGFAAGLARGLIWPDFCAFGACYIGSVVPWYLRPSNMSNRTMRNQKVMKIVWISVNVK